MTTDTKKRALRLRTLERLRELELEECRVDSVAREAALEEQSRAVSRLREDLDALHLREQALISHRDGASPELLRQLHSYRGWQKRQLTEHEAVRERRERESEAARLKVVQGFERLETIQRLRKRRGRDALLEAVRTDQKLMDEHAIVATNYRQHEQEREQ